MENRDVEEQAAHEAQEALQDNTHFPSHMMEDFRAVVGQMITICTEGHKDGKNQSEIQAAMGQAVQDYYAGNRQIEADDPLILSMLRSIDQKFRLR